MIKGNILVIEIYIAGDIYLPETIVPELDL